MGKYNFQYIKNPNNSFRAWMGDRNVFNIFNNAGDIEYFFGILCPVITANVNVTERVRAEYDTIEMLVLKLYSLGVTDAAIISQYTGLKQDMVKNILEVLENGYKHIKNGVVTKEGKQSLAEGLNIHSYRTTKQVQYEGLTGAPLQPAVFQIRNNEEAFFYIKDNSWVHKYEPLPYIDRNVKKEIMDNFNNDDTYRERNVEEVHDVVVESCTYVESFIVKYDLLPHPFIVFPHEESLRIKFLPVSISETNAKMLKNNISFHNYTPRVAPDNDFARLTEIEREMNFKELRRQMRKKFEIKDSTYVIAPKGSENAVLKLHPDHLFLPCYCVEVLKKDGTD